MKRIYYAGGTFLTGDRIANAIVDYTTALALKARAGRVQLPVMSETGTGLIEVVLGPASQLAIERVEDTRGDPVDESLVDELEARVAALHGPRAIATSGRPELHVDGFDLLDEPPA